jgi:hypothetical protein
MFRRPPVVVVVWPNVVELMLTGKPVSLLQPRPDLRVGGYGAGQVNAYNGYRHDGDSQTKQHGDLLPTRP